MTTTNHGDVSAPDGAPLSLVLCTVGRQDCLFRFLDHLARQTDRRFELIVVDQSESDALYARIMEDGTPVFFHPDLVVRHEQVDAAFGATRILRARKYAPGFGRILRVHRYGAGYFAYRIARTCFGALLAAVRLDFGKLRYKLAWAWGTLLGYTTSAAPRGSS